MSVTQPLARLIEAFQRLPGVGPKTAQRLAFHMLKQPFEDSQEFARALIEAKERVGPCPLCFSLSSEKPCEICTDANRKRTLICVVPEARDVFALERTHVFQGLYHVLGGLISPIDGVGPDQLNIRELVQRLDPSNSEYRSLLREYGLDLPPVDEVILALPPSTEGDTTSLYVSRLIKNAGMSVSGDGASRHIRTTRIAFGLPVGGDLEYADSMTLTLALQGRHEV